MPSSFKCDVCGKEIKVDKVQAISLEYLRSKGSTVPLVCSAECGAKVPKKQ